jgi:DNA polymerase-4
VIVGGGDRGVVAAACYIARQFGVRSAMPAWQALKKCPDAVVIRPRMAHYVEIGHQVRTKMLSLTPLVQPLSIDEAFLDLAGTQKLHRASPAEALHRLQQDIKRDIGITVSIGLSSTKSLAKMASDRDKPDGFFVIGSAEAEAWLASQPISVLYGIGKSAVMRLNRIGVFTCSDLAKGKVKRISTVLGSQTMMVMNLAKGIDPRPVVADREAKSVSNETTFSQDLSDLKSLETELEALCLKLSSRLKAKGIGGGTVTLKLKRANHRVITRSRSLPSRIDKAYQLFDIGRDLLIQEVGNDNKFRLLGIGVNNLGKAYEARLFDIDGGEDNRRNRLEAAVDRLHIKMGSNVLRTGRQFTKAIKAQRTTQEHIKKLKQKPK